MKSITKRILSFVLSLVMTIFVGTTAFASTGGPNNEPILEQTTESSIVQVLSYYESLKGTVTPWTLGEGTHTVTSTFSYTINAFSLTYEVSNSTKLNFSVTASKSVTAGFTLSVPDPTQLSCIAGIGRWKYCYIRTDTKNWNGSIISTSYSYGYVPDCVYYKVITKGEYGT